MPLLIFAAALILIPALIALSIPFSIVQRYRAGTMRRHARGWLAATNFFCIAISATVFGVTAAITTAWIPGAWGHSMLGFIAGSLLGFLGVFLSHWEETSGRLHYTPNRWLVLTITVIVATRLSFGIWRVWHAWDSSPSVQSWLASAGIAESMAIGAFVLGYYFTYWAGIWKRAYGHQRRSLV